MLVKTRWIPSELRQTKQGQIQKPNNDSTWKDPFTIIPVAIHMEPNRGGSELPVLVGHNGIRRLGDGEGTGLVLYTINIVCRPGQDSGYVSILSSVQYFQPPSPALSP